MCETDFISLSRYNTPQTTIPVWDKKATSWFMSLCLHR